MTHFLAILMNTQIHIKVDLKSVGEIVCVHQRWFPPLSCNFRCVQYSRHCWNNCICGFLVFDSCIFWYNFIYTTIINLKINIQASCYMAKCYLGELLLRRVVIWRVVIWRNVIWRNVILGNVIWLDVTEPSLLKTIIWQIKNKNLQTKG